MMERATGDLGRGKAGRQVERLTLALLRHTAERRQGEGKGAGERAPAGFAQPRRTVGRIEAEIEGDPATEPANKTARRALPPLLAKLKPSDPRRQAADMIADAAERMGSIQGSDPSSGGGGADSDGPSDGGATTRVKYVSRLRLAEAAANGWPLDKRPGRGPALPSRVILKVKRNNGKKRDIKALELIACVVVQGMDMQQVLAKHGWSSDSANRKALGQGALMALDDVAEAMGLGRAEPGERFDD